MPFTPPIFREYNLSMISELPDLKQIEAYCAVMTSGSMSGGAKLLGRSPSMVTRLIQDLEEALGFTLFHRNGPRIAATDQGVRFYREAQKLLGSIHRLQENTRSIAHNAESSLLIAGTPALVGGLLPRAIGRLPAALLPNRLHIQSASAQEVIHMVARKEAELGVVSFPFNNSGVKLAWVGQADCLAAVSVHDPLARCNEIDVKDLSGRRFLTMGDPFRIRSRIERALSDASVVPSGVMDSNMAMVMFNLVGQGLGVAILDPVTATTFNHPDIVVKPINVSISYLFAVITSEGTVSHSVLELCDILKQESAAMLPAFHVYDEDAVDFNDHEGT
ncbi:MAG: LysR family transcriptional regulator [Acetobacter okinawensis]|uniref:LysR family transcriptional regulator n=2 Tax=Acetobacter okinawensis TaxID=1076594 RepID=UPI0011DD84FF